MKREIIIEIEGDEINVVKFEVETRREFMTIVKQLGPHLKSLPNNEENLSKD